MSVRAWEIAPAGQPIGYSFQTCCVRFARLRAGGNRPVVGTHGFVLTVSDLLVFAVLAGDVRARYSRWVEMRGGA